MLCKPADWSKGKFWRICVQLIDWQLLPRETRESGKQDRKGAEEREGWEFRQSWSCWALGFQLWQRLPPFTTCYRSLLRGHHVIYKLFRHSSSLYMRAKQLWKLTDCPPKRGTDTDGILEAQCQMWGREERVLTWCNWSARIWVDRGCLLQPYFSTFSFLPRVSFLVVFLKDICLDTAFFFHVRGDRVTTI